MPEIHYIIGDATEPIHRPSVICHCCNDGVRGQPAWGRGFVIALSAKYPEPEQEYRAWFKNKSMNCKGGPPRLGECQLVKVKPDIWVANIIGQHGTQWEGKTPPIRYEAIEEGLEKANKWALEIGATIHAPRLGAVLAGGEWKTLEGIIKKTMVVETYVYTLPNQAWKWKDPYENPGDAWKGNPVKAM